MKPAPLLAVLLAPLLGTPALAQQVQDLPPRMLCHLHAACDAEGTCMDVSPPIPFTLHFDGAQWLWDPMANWGGRPVIVAEDPDNALARHRADLQAHRLALIPNGTTPDGALRLDGYGLLQTGAGAIVPTTLQHACRDAVDPIS